MGPIKHYGFPTIRIFTYTSFPSLWSTNRCQRMEIHNFFPFPNTLSLHLYPSDPPPPCPEFRRRHCSAYEDPGLGFIHSSTTCDAHLEIGVIPYRVWSILYCTRPWTIQTSHIRSGSRSYSHWSQDQQMDWFHSCIETRHPLGIAGRVITSECTTQSIKGILSILRLKDLHRGIDGTERARINKYIELATSFRSRPLYPRISTSPFLSVGLKCRCADIKQPLE